MGKYLIILNKSKMLIEQISGIWEWVKYNPEISVIALNILVVFIWAYVSLHKVSKGTKILTKKVRLLRPWDEVIIDLGGNKPIAALVINVELDKDPTKRVVYFYSCDELQNKSKGSTKKLYSKVLPQNTKLQLIY